MRERSAVAQATSSVNARVSSPDPRSRLAPRSPGRLVTTSTGTPAAASIRLSERSLKAPAPRSTTGDAIASTEAASLPLSAISTVRMPCSAFPLPCRSAIFAPDSATLCAPVSLRTVIRPRTASVAGFATASLNVLSLTRSLNVRYSSPRSALSSARTTTGFDVSDADTSLSIWMASLSYPATAAYTDPSISKVAMPRGPSKAFASTRLTPGSFIHISVGAVISAGLLMLMIWTPSHEGEPSSWHVDAAYCVPPIVNSETS